MSPEKLHFQIVHNFFFLFMSLFKDTCCEFFVVDRYPKSQVRDKLSECCHSRLYTSEASTGLDSRLKSVVLNYGSETAYGRAETGKNVCLQKINWFSLFYFWINVSRTTNQPELLRHAWLDFNIVFGALNQWLQQVLLAWSKIFHWHPAGQSSLFGYRNDIVCTRDRGIGFEPCRNDHMTIFWLVASGRKGEDVRI